jgi:heptosyltransferase II
VKTKKILIIGPAWIGDMVMAQTLFKILKQRDAAVEIHVLTPPWASAVLEFMPEVSKIITMPFNHGELALWARYKFAKTLRQEKYSQAIVLPNSFKSALIPFWAKIPRRTGWRGEMRYGLLNDLRILNEEKLLLMIQRFAALGLDKNKILPGTLPWPKFTEIKPEEKKQKILALCPGAEFGPAKRWPAKYFAEVALDKIDAGWEVWLFGSAKDKTYTDEIQQLTANKCKNFAGVTNLREAIILLAQADCVVSNDSGLMHIAAALDRNLVVIYGSSSPKFTPPLSTKAKLLSANLDCSPCFKRVCKYGHYNCLWHITSQAVLEKKRMSFPRRRESK